MSGGRGGTGGAGEEARRFRLSLEVDGEEGRGGTGGGLRLEAMAHGRKWW